MCDFHLEGHTDSEMERKVAFETRIHNWVMITGIFVGWVDGFHAHVEPKDEIVEIEPHAQSVCHSQLFVELVEFKLSSRLVFIIPDRPDVAGIHEEGAIEFPEEMGAVLHVEVEFHVSCLVDEVDGSVIPLERARSETSDTPSSDGVGSTRKIPFLERQHGTVAIGICQSESCVHHQRVSVVEGEDMREFEVALDILRECNVEEGVLSLTVFVELEQSSRRFKQVAAQFKIGFYGTRSIVVGQSESRPHDEEVLIVVSENDVSVADAVEIFVLEGRGNPRHVNVVEVDGIGFESPSASRLCPSVSPASRKDPSVEFWSVLHVEAQRQLGGSIGITLEITCEERSDKPREGEFRLNAILHVVLVLIPLQSCDSLKSATKLHGELFRPMEEIPILIGERHCRPQVSRRIRAFRLENDGAWFVDTILQGTVEGIGIGHLCKPQVGVPESM